MRDVRTGQAAGRACFSIAAILALLLAVVLVGAPYVLEPAEDAAILFQISNIFYKTGVISYNINDGRAEGATDFLWMLMITGLGRIGLGEFLAANLLSAIAALSTVVIVYALSGPRRSLAALTCVLGIVAAPMLPAAVAGFSNLFFGAFALAVAVLAVSRWPWAFYLVGLMCCLVRPDGTLFVASACACRWLLVSGVAGARISDTWSWRRELLPGLIAAMLGSIYFVWRWNYFGEILPLPILVKSSCEVRRFGLCQSGGMLGTVARYGLFGTVALGFFLACENKKRWPLGLTIFCSLCAFPLVVYAFLNLQQNVAHRFFYPAYLGAVILVALGLGAGRWVGWPSRVTGLVFIALLPWVSWWTGDHWYELTEKDNVARIAVELRQVQPAGRLGVTEAGLLPYISGWPTVDLWGLNTQRFAHRLFSPSDIRNENFDIIDAHALNQDSYLQIGSYCGHPAETVRRWAGMIINIFSGICDAGPTHYEMLLVPRLVKDVGAATDVPTDKDARRNREPRYDAFFLRREFAGFDAVREILVRYGALDMNAYAELRQRYLSRFATPRIPSSPTPQSEAALR